ncbi:hypothetical protein BCR41DRAFT_360821, partial [Lobosporangium transversale]
ECALDTNGFPFNLRVGQYPGVKHDVGDIYYTIFINALIKKHLSMNGFLQRFIVQMVQVGCRVVRLPDQPKDPKVSESLKQRAAALLQAKYAGLPKAKEFGIMDAYDIEDPFILTPEWVKTYSDPKEMKVFQNLRVLKDDPELKMAMQNDSTSTALKSSLDEQWESLSWNMRNIFIQLPIPYSSHSNWNFRNQQNFANSILNEVLVVHIVGINKEITSYHI